MRPAVGDDRPSAAAVTDEPEKPTEKVARNKVEHLPDGWSRVMADSGTHWRELRRGGNWPERKSSPRNEGDE